MADPRMIHEAVKPVESFLSRLITCLKESIKIYVESDKNLSQKVSAFMTYHTENNLYNNKYVNNLHLLTNN